jgi:hypothetical protein
VIIMAKLSMPDAVRRCRAAGLSVVESTAVARLHESEEDLDALIEASTDRPDDTTAPTAAAMGQPDRLGGGGEADRAAGRAAAAAILAD